MSGFWRAEVGNFTFDPGVGIFALNVRANGRNKIAHLPDAPLGRTEGESQLIRERRHLRQCNARRARTTEGTEEHGDFEVRNKVALGRRKSKAPLLAPTTREKWGTQSCAS